MTINIKAKVNVKVRQDGGHKGFLNVLNGLADHLEAIAQDKPFHQQGDIHMALTAPEQAIVARFDAATTAISDKIDALIAAGTDSPEFLTKLQSLADNLDALGKPTVPLPGPGPQPTP